MNFIVAAGILGKEKCEHNESEGGVDDNDIVATRTRCLSFCWNN